MYSCSGKTHDKDLPIEEKWAIHKSDADKMLLYFQSLEMEQPFYCSTIVLENIYGDINGELARFNEAPEVKTAKITLDPHQDGCVFIAPQQQISEFEEALNITLNTDSWFDENVAKPTSKIIYGTTNLSDKAFLKEGDYIVSEDKQYISSVLGLSSAFLQFSLTGKGTDYELINKKVEAMNKETTARHGIVFALSSNNPEAAGKRVIVFGKPTFEDVTPMEDDPRKFSSKGVYFDVKAIPTTKDHAQLRFIYGSRFASITAQKYQDLRQLYKDDYLPIADESAKNLLDNLLLIDESFKALDERVKKTKESIKNESIYYNDYSAKKYDYYMDTTISAMLLRSALQKQTEKAYKPYDDELNGKIDDLVKTYRNTCNYELTMTGDTTYVNLETARNVYTDSLVDAWNGFNKVFNEEYNKFYKAISDLVEDGTDLEAPKIKKNLEKNYKIVNEKLNILYNAILDYTQVYNDSNWTDISQPLEDLLGWFDRFKDSRTLIIK